MKLTFLIFLSASLLCCKSQPELSLDDSIVLLNAGHANRRELSMALDRLTACRPKVVGINLVFPDQQTTPYDTFLEKSIQNAGNIVMASLLQDHTIVSSDSIFTKSALAEGLIYYGLERDGSVGKHMMYISVNDDLIWSFPTTLASYFDMEKSDQIMKNYIGNQFYDIDYGNDFKVVDINEVFDCAIFSDKIVIIGYVGPDDEDSFITKSGQKRYSSWILANCVLNIQQDLYK